MFCRGGRALQKVIASTPAYASQSNNPILGPGSISILLSIVLPVTDFLCESSVLSALVARVACCILFPLYLSSLLIPQIGAVTGSYLPASWALSWPTGNHERHSMCECLHNTNRSSHRSLWGTVTYLDRNFIKIWNKKFQINIFERWSWDPLKDYLALPRNVVQW